MSSISARWHGIRAAFDSPNETSMRREVIKLIDYVILFIAVLALASALTRHLVTFGHSSPSDTSAARTSGHRGGM